MIAVGEKRGLKKRGGRRIKKSRYLANIARGAGKRKGKWEIERG